MISKVTTIPILISNNPIAIWGEGNTIQNLYFYYPIKSISVSMKDWGILILNKVVFLKIAKVENDLYIYYAVGNINIQRQENKIAAIMKKHNTTKM